MYLVLTFHISCICISFILIVLLETDLSSIDISYYIIVSIPNVIIGHLLFVINIKLYHTVSTLTVCIYTSCV